MLAVKIARKYTLEEFIEKMKSEGWMVKDFNGKPKPEQSYRNWYYRIRKTHDISGAWHMDDCNIWFYREKPPQ